MTRVAIPLNISPATTNPSAGARFELTGPTMGVTWSVRGVAPFDFDVEDAAGQVQHVLNRLADQMSAWEPNSDLSIFNSSPAGAWLDLPADFLVAMRRALWWAEESDGAFDPTLGRLTNLWGFGPTGAGAVAASPSPQAIQAALDGAGWDKLPLDRARLHQPGGLELDLSAIARGYAVDQISRVMSELRVIDHLVEIDGELRGEGVQSHGEPWWAEIAPPPGETLPGGRIRVALHGLSIAASGDHHRHSDVEGRRYGHLLDPRLGQPLQSPVRSVSVLAAACMDADALCTVLGVLGPVRGMALAVRHDIAAHFLLQDEDGSRELLSPKLQAMID
jgi:thiamine biosynthesis lipoprotein